MYRNFCIISVFFLKIGIKAGIDHGDEVSATTEKFVGVATALGADFTQFAIAAFSKIRNDYVIGKKLHKETFYRAVCPLKGLYRFERQAPIHQLVQSSA
jgi:hypothetical protein